MSMTVEKKRRNNSDNSDEREQLKHLAGPKIHFDTWGSGPLREFYDGNRIVKIMYVGT